MNSPDYSSKEDDNDIQAKNRDKMRFFFVEEHLSRQFSNLGGMVAKRPFCFTLLPIFLTAVFSTGLSHIKINRDFNFLFSATDGKAEQTRILAQKLFPMNTSSFFDMPRVTMTSEFLMLVITAKDEGSMLRKDIFEEVQNLDKVVKNTTVWLNDEPVNYMTICGKRVGACVNNDVLELSPYLREIRSGRRNIHYPVYIDNITFTYKEYIQAIGGVEVDNRGYLRDFKAMRLIYALDITNKNKHKQIYEWQIAVANILTNMQFREIRALVVSDNVLGEEIQSYTAEMLKRAPFVVLTIVLFSFVSCMSFDCVRSKQWLGPLACVSAGLAIASAIGLLCHLGVEYIDFCILLCYAILTSEIDDAFIFIASWRITDPNEPVERRMQQVFSQSAVSVTITSLTTVLSFSIGISSTIPAIRICCIYGATCCLFAYIYLFSFFGGCMAISGYREERKLHPFTFRRINDNASREEPSIEPVTSLVRRTLEPILRHKIFKIFTAIVFFTLLALGIKGINTIKCGSELSDGFNYYSPTQETISKTYKYFGRYTTPVQIIIKEHLNYADPSVQKTIDEIMANFTSYKHIAEPDLEMSWLKHYKMYQNLPFGKMMLNTYNMTDEREFVFALKDIFLKMPQTRPYVDDINFNEEGTKITSSRFILLMKDIYESETEIVAIKELYDIASKSPIPIEIFGLVFAVLESSFNVPTSTAKLAAICCSLVCVAFILFAPNIPYALCISVVVLCSIIEVIGLVSFLGIKLDYVTLITFSYSIGLCINYPSHMTFAILIGSRKYTSSRRNAFYRLAYPISQGCFSTVLGLLSVAVHPHYISQSAFKVISSISLLSAFHGLFTIPLLLGVFGDRFKKNSEIRMRKTNTFEKSLLDEDEKEDKY